MQIAHNVNGEKSYQETGLASLCKRLEDSLKAEMQTGAFRNEACYYNWNNIADGAVGFF
jgi:hypothetical protein